MQILICENILTNKILKQIIPSSTLYFFFISNLSRVCQALYLNITNTINNDNNDEVKLVKFLFMNNSLEGSGG